MLITTKVIRKGNLFLIIVLLFLLSYVIYRACSLCFTHDEALSFKIILGDRFLAGTANNHLLNTFLMSVCYKFLGNSEISLRLPNILGFMLYAFACFELLKNKSFIILFSGICLLLLNPYLIDFFSLARGYGLALGFFMMSVLYLLRATSSRIAGRFYRYGSIALLFSTAACFSNLVYLNANLVILFLLFVSFLRLDKKSADNSWWTGIAGSVLFINLCCTGGLIIELMKLKATNELYYGGSTGFITDTVAGLVTRSLYSESNLSAVRVISIILVVLYVIMCLYVLVNRSYNQIMIVLLFLSLMIGGPMLQFYFMDALLPLGRTALLYIPLMGLCITFFISGLLTVHSRMIRYAAYTGCFLLIFINTCNFVNNMNKDSCYEWRYDACTKNIMNKIGAFACYSGADEAPFVLSCHYFLEPSVYYYKIRDSMDFLILSGEIKKNADEDFVFSLNSDWDKMINADEFLRLETFDAEGVTVLKNKYHQPSKELYRKDIGLHANNNKFLSCETDHRIIGNKDKPNLWETFSLIGYADNKCAFRSYEGFFLCPELDSNAELTATRQKRGSWEIFDIYNLGSGLFVFKAANNKFLSLDKNTGQIYASATRIGENEIFTLIEK